MSISDRAVGRSVFVALVVLLASCAPATPDDVDEGDDGRRAEAAAQSPSTPEIPVLQLAPRLEDFRTRAEFSVDTAKIAELIEVYELAEGDDASGRTQARARRSFAGEKGAARALEEVLVAHDNARLRAVAAFELGARAARGALPILLKRLKYEKDDFARVEIAFALAQLDNLAGMTELARHIDGPNEALRQRAGTLVMQVAKRFGSELPEAPTWRDLARCARDFDLRWRGEGSIAAAPAEKLDDPEGSAASTEDPQVERAILDARIAGLFVDLEGFQLRPVDDARFILTRMGRVGMDDLELALSAREPYLRNHSLEVVRDLERVATRLAPAVRPLLRDPLSRALACRTLGAIGDARAIPWCIDFLDSPHLELRTAAATALGSLGASEAKPKLTALVRDEATPMDLRVAAAGSLAILELERPWWRWLVELRSKGGYHAPTLDELLDRIDVRVEQSRRR